MNRLAIISDIHGNLHALEAVLRRIADLDVDQIICLGDVVGYGPFPERCLDLVIRHCSVIVRGNHDDAVIDPEVADQFNGAAREAIYWTRKAVGPLHFAALNKLPRSAVVLDSILCVHDNPMPGPGDYVHDKNAAALAFAGVHTNLCLIGHTHVPMVFEAPGISPDEPSAALTAPELVAYLPQHAVPVTLDPERRYICNPGSVGQPRDCDPRASFALLDMKHRAFTVLREPYDVVAAQDATQRAGLPFVLAERLAIGA